MSLTRDFFLRRGRAVLLGVAAVVFFIDRVTKLWALSVLKPRFEIPLLPFFHLTYVENTGAAFGMFRGSNTALIVVAIGLLGVLWYLGSEASHKSALFRLGVALVAGGALGNLYDRFAYGYVVDFLDFRIWPVFNAADSCISAGAALLAWTMVRNPPRRGKR